MSETKFARIITMRARRGKGREFVRVFKKDIAATSVKLQGLRRLYLFRQVGKTDEFVVLSLWDSQKSAEGYAKSDQNKAYSRSLARVQKGREKVRKLHVELRAVGRAVRRKGK